MVGISKLLRPHISLLIIIMLIGLFFRTYQIVKRFEFAHDGDLYSWIAKDIVIDKHPRLIGQLTSVQGIYIGPLFYYLLVPFFLISRMDPIGAVIPITIIGMFTILSYYLVFKKLFNPTVGLIAGFLQAVLLSPVLFDREAVPSAPTNIWAIWYFYCVVSILRGNFKVFPLLAILIGLIWHIHIALIPALVAIPIGLLLNKKLLASLKRERSGPSKKLIFKSLIILIFVSAPLILFEIRHNFIQTRSIITNSVANYGGGVGFNKFDIVTIKIGRNFTRLLLYPNSLPFIEAYHLQLITVLLFLSLSLILVKKKLLKWQEVLVFFTWIAVVVAFYTFTTIVPSEYYLTNIEVIYIAILSLLFYLVYQSGVWGRRIVYTILVFTLIKNLYYFINLPVYQKGYLARKTAANFIANQAKEKHFPCVAVSYIIKHPGEDVGFRYFFYLNNLHVNQPKSGSPVYTIVIPDEIAKDDIKAKFGNIGIIPPKEIPSQEKIKESCSGLNSNLTDPMLGYTN